MLEYEDNYYEFSKRCSLSNKDMIFPLFVDENDKFQELNVMQAFLKFHIIILSNLWKKLLKTVYNLSLFLGYHDYEIIWVAQQIPMMASYKNL